MRAIATLTSKGQLTLPKDIRDLHGLKPGDRVEFIHENGRTEVKPRNRRLIDLVGILGPPPNGPKTLEEIKEGIATAWAEAGSAGMRGGDED